MPKTGEALLSGRRVSWAFNTRIAIRASVDLLGLRPGDEVLAPAYHCGSEVDPLLHAGLKVTLFPVAQDLVVRPEDVAARITPATKAIYVIHYFGWLQPHMQALRDLCDARGLRLMEDCALSLLSGDRPAEGHWGDVAFFCAYKFLPVLGGGALVVNAPDLPDPPHFSLPVAGGEEWRFALRRTLAATGGLDVLRGLKRRLRPGQEVPHGTDQGADNTDQDIPASYYFDEKLMGRAISAATARAIRRSDPGAIIAARRANWQLLRDLVSGIPQARLLFEALPDWVCPLSLPVLIPDRDRIAARLQAQGEDVTPWWSGFHRRLDWAEAGDAICLKNAVLALPVAQGLQRPALERSAARLAAALSA